MSIRLFAIALVLLLFAPCCLLSVAADKPGASATSVQTPAVAPTSTKKMTREVVEFSYEDDLIRSTKLHILEMKDANHKVEVQRSPRHIVIIDRTSNHQIDYRSRFSGRRTADLTALRAMAKLYPKSMAVLIALSMGYENERNWAKAIEIREQADALGIDKFDQTILTPAEFKDEVADNRAGLLSKRGYYECMLGKYDAAVKDLSEAIALRPRYHMNYRNRMVAYEKLGRTKDAENDKLKLRQLFATNTVTFTALSEPGASLSKIMSEVADSDAFEEGIVAINQILKNHPNFYQCYLCRADLEIYTGKYQEALQDYNILLRQIKCKFYQTERQHVLDLIKSGPPPYGDLTNMLTKARYEIARGKSVSAMDLAKMHLGDMRVYVSIFRGLVEHQKMAEAQREGQKILSICPPRKKFSSAFNYLENAKDPEIVDACTDYLNDPTRVSYEYVALAYITRARALHRMKEYSRAIADYGMLIELEPKSAEAFRDRADCYMDWKHYKEAILDYTSAITFDPDKSKSNYSKRAKAYAAIGENALAKKDTDMFALLDADGKRKSLK